MLSQGWELLLYAGDHSQSSSRGRGCHSSHLSFGHNISWSPKHTLPLTSPTLPGMPCHCLKFPSYSLDPETPWFHEYAIPSRMCFPHFVHAIIIAILTPCNNWVICTITLPIRPGLIENRERSSLCLQCPIHFSWFSAHVDWMSQ